MLKLNIVLICMKLLPFQIALHFNDIGDTA